MTTVHADIEVLKGRACALADAAESLATLLDEEATRLKRMDQIERLRQLGSDISKDFEAVRQGEDRARSGESEVTAVDLLAGLATKLIGKASDSKSLQIMSDHLLTAPTRRNPTFGTVLVAIGPKGLPDDARVVSVSFRARESKRPESEIIKELRSAGKLLFSERSFSLLIDSLSNDILNGKLSLPVPMESLSLLIPRQVRLVRGPSKQLPGPDNKG